MNPGSLGVAFEQSVDSAPGSVAVASGETCLTYAELDARANAVAHELAARGVPPGSRVGVTATREPDTVAAVLGVLKHGCAYVPLDPSYPADLLGYLAADAGLDTVIGAGPLPVPGVTADVVAVSDLVPTARRPTIPVAGDAAAYVIYTSGSTGRPKGVVVEHRNVLALLDATRRHVAAGPGDVWTVFHSFCFDFSVWEMWGALHHGGRLVCVPSTHTVDPAAFLDLLRSAGVTVLNAVPSVFRQFAVALEDDPVRLPALRTVVFGGEALDADAVGRWLRASPLDRPTFLNMYGITEVTVHVTAHLVDAEDLHRTGGTRIGEPLPHLRALVLGPDGLPAEPGAAGELLVAGAGVARGYLGRDALTRERFVTMPGPDGPRRWFRTGDLVRSCAGGLEYLGRIDDQAKIRGFRIEPGEIDGQLRGHPAVADVATVVETGASGDPVLVSHVVPTPAAAGWERELAEHARRVLPRHMVPAVFRAVAALPRTPSGKVDRRALAARAPAGPVDQTRIGVASSSSRSSGSSGGIDAGRSTISCSSREAIGIRPSSGTPDPVNPDGAVSDMDRRVR